MDSEVLDYYREHRFRKTYGGSHEDFLSQPRQVTDWLIAISGIEQEVANG